MDDIRHSRQASLVPKAIQDLGFLVIGVGGIGSNVVHTLASMGAKNIKIYDPDTVAEENLWPQYFGEPQLGTPKVEALASTIKSQLGVEIEAVNRKFVATPSGFFDVVILGVDSLRARRVIWQHMSRAKMTWRLFVDGRMGGRGATIIFLDKNNEDAAKYYEDHMLPTGVPNDLPCGEKATAYLTKGIIPGIIAGGIAQWLNKKPLPNEWTVDFDMTPWVHRETNWFPKE